MEDNEDKFNIIHIRIKQAKRRKLLTVIEGIPSDFDL